MQKNTTKKAFLLSLASMLLCLSMLVGSTFAWFTDTVTSGVNKIVAGNLDIEVEYTKDNGATWANLEGSSDLFQGALWEPGHTEYVTLKIHNAGTLELNYKALVTPVSENGGINVNGQPFKLSNYLVFGTTTPTTTAPASYTRETARAAVGTTMGLTDVNDMTKTGVLAAGETVYITLVVYMPESVGNDANYKPGTAAPTIELGIKVIATQKTAESDSFGDDYDEDAITDPGYVAGAYYDYFEAVYVTADPNTDGSFELKKEESSSVIASAVGVASASDKPVSLTVVKSSDTATFTIPVGEGEELTGYDIKVTGHNPSTPVQVKLYVGTGLQNFKLYHEGVSMTVGTKGALTDGQYFYDSSEGYVYFASTTFSPFHATYQAPEASIGTVTYGTLKDALKAAKTGDTVTLLKDIVATLPNHSNYANESVFEILTSITLNGNGKTITADPSNWAKYNNAITGLIFSVGSQNANYTNAATVAIKNLAIVGHKDMKHGISIVKSANATTILDLDNVNISGCGANALSVNGTTVRAKNVVTSDCGWGGVDVDKEGYLTIESGKYDLVKRDDTDSVISITGGTFGNDVTAFVAEGYGVMPVGGLYKVVRTWLADAAASFATPVDVNNKIVTIASAAELALFAKNIGSYQNYTVEITKDIDLSGKIWTPMSAWNGTFDGNGNTISGMFVNADNAYGNGFFNKFGNSGTAIMKDITFDNATVQRGNGKYSGNVYGIIAGYAAHYGNVEFINVTVKNSTVWGFGKVGGFFGMGELQGGHVYFTNCAVENVTIKSSYNGGGFAGLIHHAVSGSKNTVIFDNCETPDVTFITSGIMVDGAPSVAVEGLEGLYTVYQGKYFYADTALYFNEYLPDEEQELLGVDAIVHNTAYNMIPTN